VQPEGERDLKFVQINDPHTSDKPPRNRTRLYNDQIFAKLQEAFDLANAEDANYVVFTGDLFHNPQATRVSHALVNRWCQLLSDNYQVVSLIVPGNHDLSAGRIESMDRQPLGVLANMPNVEILTRENGMFDANGIKMFGVEWDYKIDAAMILEAARGCDVLITHAPIAWQSNPYYDTIHPDELDELRARVICYGHIHVPEPLRSIREDTWDRVVQYSRGSGKRRHTVVSNPGALSRGSLTANDVERTPQVAVIEVTDKTVTARYEELQAAPAAEVFRLESAEMEKFRDESIREFTEQLRSAEVKAVTVEELADAADKLTKSKSVRAEARQILFDVR